MDAQHAQPLPQTAASQQPCLKPADGSSNEAAAAASAAGGGPLPFWRHSYPPRLVLVSDLVQNEDTTHKHLLTFNALWHMYDTASRNLLVYSTGRSPRLYRELWEEAPLLTPHVLICSVGTEIFYLVPEPDEPRNGDGDDGGDRGGGSNAALDAAALAGGCVPRRHRYEPDAEWEALLDKGWDRQRVLQVAARFPELRRQVDSEQRRHKLSFHLEAPGKAAAVAQTADAAAAAAAAAPPSSTSRSTAATVEAPATPEDTAVGAATPTVQPREPHEVLRLLEEALREEGLKVKVVYSGGRDVDLLAEGAGKGAALRFLLGRLRRAGLEPVDGVQVNGDSGNDIELFQVPGVCGCVVANAFPELREFARKRQQQAKEEEEEQRPAGATHACKVFQASEPCAGGILQALRHFRLLPPPALHPPASRVDDDDDGRSPTSLVAAAHARLLDCGGDAAAAAASGGGGGGAGGDEAEVIQGDVAAAAAAAAAAGVWMDELELHAAKPAAGGDDAAAVAGAPDAAPAAVAGVEWVMRFKAYRLLPNGRRNLGKMDRMLLLVYGSSGCGGVGKGPESASSMDTLSTAAAGDAAPAAPAAGGEVQRLIARLVRGGSFGLRDVPLPPDV